MFAWPTATYAVMGGDQADEYATRRDRRQRLERQGRQAVDADELAKLRDNA
ncbi:MAG: hypothetical protein QM775_01580 [Pirellulales bacterium]